MKSRAFLFVLAAALSIASAHAASWGSACEATLQSPISGEEVARAAGLHYASPGGPGIIRNGSKETGFFYLDPTGKRIEDASILQRIDNLRIPPGYRDVWISPDPEAHIQATALDAKGREQYRYHPRWIEAKSGVKFSRMARFGRALPAIHAAEDADLELDGLPKNKVLAAMTRLLEETSIRVGNARYAAANESYGLSTLLREQVRVEGSVIHFSFKGKSGVFHDLKLEDPLLARITQESLALGQPTAFAYEDAEGGAHALDSSMINGYLQDLAQRGGGGHFTAKDFRTWGGTTFAAQSLLEAPVPRTSAEAQANIDAAIQYAASRLGNTPAVCKSNYIDPRLLAAYLDGNFQKAALTLRERAPSGGLKPEEKLVLLLTGS